MYWVIILLFLILLFLLSMRKEGMENPTRSIIGPTKANIYDPTYNYPRPSPKHRKRCKHPRPHPRPEPEPRPIPEDDGTHASDTATSQFSIYFYKPFATLPFPTSPPPQPYLNDFKVFQQ